jgi:AcrR family transcriptional regulator
MVGVRSPGVDAATQRRARHEQINRELILDAAERAFGDGGYRGASIRDIAGRAGFSSAALYLFFENKFDLYCEVLARRGGELHQPALARLHEMADVAIDFYRRHPAFAGVVAQAHATFAGSPLAEWQQHPDERVKRQFQDAMDTEADVMRQGQRAGEIREADPHALAHLFSVIVNSYLAVGAEANGGLTLSQLHSIIDGAFRRD